jgi:hypothetical protein
MVANVDPTTIGRLPNRAPELWAGDGHDDLGDIVGSVVLLLAVLGFICYLGLDPIDKL